MAGDALIPERSELSAQRILEGRKGLPPVGNRSPFLEQKRLAQEIEVDVSTLRNWEKEGLPKEARAHLSLARRLRRSMGYLLGNSLEDEIAALEQEIGDLRALMEDQRMSKNARRASESVKRAARRVRDDS
jgi:DNA-binding XRE family transcriptional regulator